MVWDERKRAIDLLSEPAGQRLDVLDARDRFAWDSALVVPTYPGPDGRARFIAIGWLDGHLRARVFAPLCTQAVSAISLRPASRRERSLYDDA